MEEIKTNIQVFLSNYRQAIMILFLTLSAGILSGLVDYGTLRIIGLEIPSYKLPILITTGGLLFATAAFLNKYLDKRVSVIEEKVTIEDSGPLLERLEKQQAEQERLRDELEQIQSAHNSLLIKVSKEQAHSLSNDELQNLIDDLKKEISASAAQDYVDELKESLVKAVDKTTATRLEKHFIGTMKRLSNEINELGRRAKVNLIIGSIAALSGVSVFVLFVFERVSPDAVNSYLITDFAPRLSLVIVIEIFAYFFLGLYKSNLSEIKYFHNELTNVESRYLALEEALAVNDKETTKIIITEISKTERNFLLKKGESTVSTEEKRMAIEENRNTIQSLSKILGRRGA